MSAAEKRPNDGILASGRAKRPKKGGIVWDEENLEMNEREKSSTMKITEPDTPYNYYNEDDDEEVQDALKGEEWDADNAPAVVVRDVTMDEPGTTNNEDKGEWDSSSEGGKGDLSDSDDGLTPEERAAKAEEFKKKRAMHYNHAEMMRKFREEQLRGGGDDDDDDDSEGGGGGAPKVLDRVPY